MREQDFHVGNFLKTIFLSRHFYERMGVKIKSPAELVVSTYKLLNLEDIPGVPDFNSVTESLGQRLLHPPTVAGWSHGKNWITPSLLFERGNFVLDVLFPDLNFVPPDRFPVLTPEVARVQARLRQGQSITCHSSIRTSESYGMAQSNLMADQDEDFNTRLGSTRMAMAIERVTPIVRNSAKLDLTASVIDAGCNTTIDIAEYFNERFFVRSLPEPVVKEFARVLEEELGTNDVLSARGYLEEPLRQLLHAMLSRPEYQLS